MSPLNLGSVSFGKSGLLVAELSRTTGLGDDWVSPPLLVAAALILHLVFNSLASSGSDSVNLVSISVSGHTETISPSRLLRTFLLVSSCSLITVKEISLSGRRRMIPLVV